MTNRPEQQQPAEGSAGLEAVARAARVLFNVLIVSLVAAVFFFLWKSFFVVREHEVGVILRFGKIVEKDGKPILERGLHVSFPHPIDERIRIPAKRKDRVETTAFMLPDDAAERVSDDKLLRPGTHGYHLTGDTSILHSRWVLEYTIADPVAYATRFYDRETDGNQVKPLLRLLLNNAVTRAAAALPMVEVWQNRDEAMRKRVWKILTMKIDELGIGVQIHSVRPVAVKPPRQLQTEFESVTKAQEERRQNVATAEGKAKRLISEADIAEARTIAAASSESITKLNRTRADIDAYNKLYPQYKKDPELFRRIYVEERLRKIFSRVDEKFVVDQRRQRQLRIHLNADPRKKPTDVPDNR